MMSLKVPNKRSQGKYYERWAEDFLNTKGYTTVMRNFYYRSWEIDLIMLSPDNILVFVEVKFRRTHNHAFHPWETLPYKKQQNLFRAASGFLDEHPNFINHYSRYDAVIITPNNSTESGGEKYQIEHFLDAFRE